LQVAFFDGEGYFFSLLDAFALKWGSSAQGRIEGNIILATIGRCGPDIAPMFTLGARRRPPPGMTTG